MLFDVNGKEMPAIGVRDHWEEFKNFQERNPAHLAELRQSVLDYVEKNPHQAISNYWAKELLDAGQTALSAGLLGCTFWWTLAMVEGVEYCFLQQENQGETLVRKYWRRHSG